MPNELVCLSHFDSVKVKLTHLLSTLTLLNFVIKHNSKYLNSTHIHNCESKTNSLILSLVIVQFCEM